MPPCSFTGRAPVGMLYVVLVFVPSQEVTSVGQGCSFEILLLVSILMDGPRREWVLCGAFEPPASG